MKQDAQPVIAFHRALNIALTDTPTLVIMIIVYVIVLLSIVYKNVLMVIKLIYMDAPPVYANDILQSARSSYVISIVLKVISQIKKDVQLANVRTLKHCEL